MSILILNCFVLQSLLLTRSDPRSWIREIIRHGSCSVVDRHTPNCTWTSGTWAIWAFLFGCLTGSEVFFPHSNPDQNTMIGGPPIIGSLTMMDSVRGGCQGSCAVMHTWRQWSAAKHRSPSFVVLATAYDQLLWSCGRVVVWPCAGEPADIARYDPTDAREFAEQTCCCSTITTIIGVCGRFW